ncbi:uncharacterized protein LOC100904390 [Galendromus occidentalis]|uniref:Uncharacterized protein LOC100904390 n=1 Tax=Galendromus occidentalis TaxID=34638 RepID=A0AAJ6QLY0_9ACAR|nr:uncharacterized protein LOC100904390 [Galendromus occidentalis]
MLERIRRRLGWTGLLFLAGALVMSRACTSGKCLNQGSRVFYRTNNTPQWSDASVFIGGDTVAEVRHDDNRTSCRLTLINGDKDREEVLRAFPNASDIPLKDMMQLIKKCGEAEGFFEERSWTAKKLSMYPGTLWCGPGDYASNYSHLGESSDIDRCCRNHDFCPIKIYAGQTRFGLKPPFLKASLLCECEQAFDECLREAENASSDPSSIRQYYFNLIDAPCLYRDSDGTYSLMSFEEYNSTLTTSPD